MRRPFVVGFLLLTLLFVLTLSGAYLYDYHSKAPWRDGWADLTDRLRVEKSSIDSLQAEVESGERRVAVHRSRLDSLEARLALYEQRAVGGRLPRPEHRAYLEVIEAQNQAAETHNEALADVREVYEEYAELVRAHNAVIDSANRFRRAAAEEGVRLKEVELR
ncbi:MAG TPA: hypothetical protein VFG78_00600 [Gemmatimonadota bacterium]|nr:hypothetical protein [Gemmatimonadota bacterium]